MTARFMSRVKKTNGCWYWKGIVNTNLYGSFFAGGLRIPAHRFSYMVYSGEIADGLCVCHKCDNPPCVNPSHLFLGTKRVNAMDRDLKGRTGTKYKSMNNKCNQCNGPIQSTCYWTRYCSTNCKQKAAYHRRKERTSKGSGGGGAGLRHKGLPVVSPRPVSRHKP